MDALRQAQLEFDPVLKDTRNPLYNSKYAELSGVIAATQPSLAKHGLVISQLAASDLANQGAGVITMLVHSSGEFIANDLLLPAAGRGKGDTIRYDAQTACGAITYARRYAYLAIIGVAAEDDDGNQASGHLKGRSNPNERGIPDYNDYRGMDAVTHPEQYHGPTPEPIQRPLQPPQPVLAPTTPKSAANAPAAALAPPPPPQREPGDESAYDNLPSEEGLAVYRAAFKKLGDDLSASGHLKASKGLKLNAKLVTFLLYITKQKDPAAITVGQWDDFFLRADAALTNPEIGLKGIALLVNQANGIEEK